ncbi:MAG: hypothetical protein V4436_01155 [Patescibacteria group bacterium]
MKLRIEKKIPFLAASLILAIVFLAGNLPKADAGGPPSVKYPPTSPTGAFPGLQFGQGQCTSGWGTPQFIPGLNDWSGWASSVSNFDPDCVRAYMDTTPIPANTDIRFCSQTHDGSYFLYGSDNGPLRCSPWISTLSATGGTVITPWVSSIDNYNPDQWKIEIETRVMPNDGITSRSVNDLRLGVQVADHLFWNSGCSEQVGSTRYTPYKNSGGGWSNPMSHDGEEHEDMNCIRFYLQATPMISRLMPALTLTGPTSITSGETATLTYTVANADTCTLTGTNGDSWSGFSTNGSKVTGAITPPVTYTLSCTGPGGTNIKQHTIGGACTVGNICVGNSAYSVNASCTQTLVQACTGSCVAGACIAQSACTLDGVTVPHGSFWTFYSQSSVPSGQQCSSVSQSRTCNNGVLNGDPSYNKSNCTTVVQDSVNITANGALTSTAVRKASSATIAWNGGNATSCTISGTDGSSFSGVTGSQSVVINQKTIFTATCTLQSSTKIGTVIVNILPSTIEI